MTARTADMIIVGGGCMGPSAARRLAERGAGRVLLLEKGFKHSPMIGRLMADLILANGAAEPDLAFFSLARLAGGAEGHVSPFRCSRPRITR